MNTSVLRWKNWWIVLWLLACCLPAFGQSEKDDTAVEQIESFSSALTLRTDATLQVTETIKIISTGTNFQHGIIRTFPLSYPTRFGLCQRLELTDIQVKRDDVKEQFTLERDWNGQRVRIGDFGALLTPGAHTYTLSYQIAPEIAYYRDHDALLWDVTGSDWPVNVVTASATLTLPRVTSANGITPQGMIGARDSHDLDKPSSDVKAEVSDLGEVSLYSTRPLKPAEGLRLLVQMPKGVVTPPAFNAVFFFQDNPTLFWALIATLAMLAYYIILWVVTGREEARGPIVPRGTPPEQVSPAVARYLRTGACDHRMLAAALADMAVKRCIQLTKNGDIYSVSMVKDNLVRERDRRTAAGTEESALGLAPMTSEERALLSSLLLSGHTFTFIPANHGVIKEAMQRFTGILKQKYAAAFFTAPTQFVVIGAVLSLLALIGIGLSDASHNSWRESARSVVGLMMTGVGVYLLGTVIVKAWQQALGQAIEQLWAIIQTLFITLIVLALGLGGIYLLRYSSLQMVMLLIALGIVNLVFAAVLRRRTRHGQRILDQLEGFVLFLTTGRVDHRTEKKPERTTELFERYLPYAIALEVERAWSDQFIYNLSRDEGSKLTYTTEWFQVLDSRPLNIRTFIQALGSELPKAITQASLSTSNMVDETL